MELNTELYNVTGNMVTLFLDWWTNQNATFKLLAAMSLVITVNSELKGRFCFW